jgi:ATP-dependent 26S proteasome regulatory subunit
MNLQTGTFAGAGFDSNPHIPLNPFDQHQMTRQLQNIMQFQLIKHISTGNFIIDTMIQVIMMALVTYCVTQIKFILDWVFMWIGRGYTWTERTIRSKISQWRGTIPQFTKTVDIPFISDSRQINELYKAVHWFLSSNTEIDYIKESSLQYVCEKKLESINTDLGLPISKILNQNKSKKILYKGHQINFLFDTETITIYTDKEKKRDNFKVKLWTQIDEKTKTDILEEFCQMCVVKYLESIKAFVWKQQIFINKGSVWEASESKNVRKLETVVLPQDIKDEIKDDMEVFLNSEEWYLHRDIPYTRGYLLYGLPGTGKTSLIKALSLHYKKHIAFLILNSVESDNQLIELIKSIDYKITILIIEDIDAMIDLVKSRELANKSNSDYKTDDSENSEENKSGLKGKKELISTLTFSGILNAIDGVFNTHGRIMFMTTNKPEILDQALIRAGRCDVKKQFSFCDRKQIQELFYMFFEKEAPIGQIDKIKQYMYSPAHVSSVFMRYRNTPDLALHNLDETEQKVFIKPMIDLSKC